MPKTTPEYDKYERLTDTEKEFFRKVTKAKKCKIYRHGWPDFLLYNAETGRYYCVEVKSVNDEIRESQYDMFAVLEHMGIHTYIWTPGPKDDLIHWREWRFPSRERRFRIRTNKEIIALRKRKKPIPLPDI